jgi:hypothetical protein
MSNVINLDEKRSKKKCDPAWEELLLEARAPNSDTRINNAFSIFAMCSGLRKKRQLDLLYKILWTYYFKRRPISVDKMTEMLISYMRKNKRHFEKITGNSMSFDFDEEPNLKERLRRIDLGVRKRDRT